MSHLTLRVAFATLLLVVSTACGGGGSPAEPDQPFEIGAGPHDGPGGATPAPADPPPGAWRPDAVPHGRVPTFGAFPSDLVRHGQTLFVNDADEITTQGALIRALDLRGDTPVGSLRFSDTTIRAGDLIDSAGAPATFPTTIGFGLFLNDLHVVDDGLAFVLVNAGGSDSAPTLANLVVFDPRTGARLQTVSLTHSYIGAGPLFDSRGAPVSGDRFVQSNAESVAFVASGPGTGLLYVAMANVLVGSPSFGTHRLPGTVQIYRVDRAQPQPVTPIPELGQATRTLRTIDFNPVSVDVLAGAAIPRVLVTCGGTTGFNASFQLEATSDASVEVYDGALSSFLGRFTLGRVGLVGAPALGRDGRGNQVGFFPSGVTGRVYLLELTGLYGLAVDLSALSVVRGPGNGIPIAGPAGSPGGNITGVALSPNGRTLVVSGFGDLFSTPRQPGHVYLAALPTNVVTGSTLGISFVPGSTRFASAIDRTVGTLVLDPNHEGRPDVYVNVGGTVGPTGLGVGPASLGVLDSGGQVR